MVKKCVVLLSGGIDSATLAYWLTSQQYEVWPLSIKYGQTHEKELMAARNISEQLGIVKRLKVVDLSSLKNLLPSTLTGKGEIPEGVYNEPSMTQTVVPGRNLIFLAVAAGYAQGIEAGTVAYAAHAGDHYIYPDCREKFVYAASSAMLLGYGINLLTPFLHSYKNEVVSTGTKLKVPFWMTWSCYKGGEKHCGKCGTCDERKKAFADAKVEDPTVYES